MIKKIISSDSFIFAVVLIIGIILRFYNYSNLPYSFDEFSALFRTYFTNFNDLIHFGVVTSDTHPAGIQVFMHYWVHVFGRSEMVVKFPFMIFGIAAIWLTYKIGKNWFNPTVGLIGAMYLAFLQYPITYSQYARPYASGLFFSLLMVFFWSASFFENAKPKKWHIAGYVFAGALCSYNHHFSLFLVALVWLSGVFFISKKQFKIYFLAGLAIFILYIPHLQIFFIQLKKGGVESWLHKPDPTFFMEYIKYILHYDWYFYVLTGLLLILGLLFGHNGRSGAGKYRVMMLIWLLVTYLSGYFYSVYVSALLQYSVILFVFPFLILLVFSFIKDINPGWKYSMLIVIGFVSIYSLIYVRKHYEIQYQSGYKESLVEAQKMTNELTSDNVTTVTYLPGHIEKYYTDKLHIHLNKLVILDSLSELSGFESYVKSRTTDYFILTFAGLHNLEFYPIVKSAYPFMKYKKTWYLADFYVFSKYEKPDLKVHKDELVFAWDTIFYSGTNRLEPDTVFHNSSGLLINQNVEYVHLFSREMALLTDHPNNYIFLKLKVARRYDKPLSALLVTEIKQNDICLDWRAANFDDFGKEGQEIFTIYKAIKLPDLGFDLKPTKLNVYVWNKQADDFYIEEFNIETVKGNPVVYGLLEEIID